MPDSRKVLVVEDERNIRDLVCLHLGLEGYECTPVADGKEAMAMASEKPFDLIILDLMLPNIDGVTICRAIRRHGPNRDAPILMLTARREEADKVMGLDSGADDYLTKPFGVRELIARGRADAPIPRAAGHGANRRPAVERAQPRARSRAARGTRARRQRRRHTPGIQPPVSSGLQSRHRLYARAVVVEGMAGTVVRHRPQRGYAGEAAAEKNRGRSGGPEIDHHRVG